MSRSLIACMLLLIVTPALAEGPQEQALDRSLNNGSGQPMQQQATPAPATDPSQVTSRPTQTEPATEGPEEKALDRSMKTPGVPDGDTE